MKTIFAALLSVLCCNMLSAQKFWLTTYAFPGGPKTGITLASDSCLFVGLQAGIIRSCDEGNGFDSILDASVIFTVFASKSGKVFAGGAGEIFYTDNLGQTWDSVSINSTYPVVQFLENHDGDLFAITGTLDINLGFVGDGVLFSVDGGTSWSQRNNGLGIYKSCQHIAIDKNDRLYLAAADEFVTGNGGLFVSDDKGLNWQHIQIYVDGQGAIENKLNIESISCLEVSPQDSVVLSFSGVSRDGGSGVGVTMNLLKHINDIDSTKFWTPRQVFNSVSWWLDRKLNNIHCARNGDWYSSTIGSTNSGGTYFSADHGVSWNFIDFGLGVDILGGRNIQHFAETSSGKVFMIQYVDERVYWTDTSVLTSRAPIYPREKALNIFPNPIRQGEKFILKASESFNSISVFLIDISGRIISSQDFNGNQVAIRASMKTGIYFITARTPNGNFTEKLVVY